MFKMKEQAHVEQKKTPEPVLPKKFLTINKISTIIEYENSSNVISERSNEEDGGGESA